MAAGSWEWWATASQRGFLPKVSEFGAGWFLRGDGDGTVCSARRRKVRSLAERGLKSRALTRDRPQASRKVVSSPQEERQPRVLWVTSS